jgi:hypothetical protein
VLTTPAVIAHGRLVVLGGDNQRLHEEIIMAGGVIREGRFSRMNVGETKTVHDAALTDPAPAGVCKRLQDLWPSISNPLLQSLEARMTDRTKGLQKTLDERCEQEVANIAAVLRELEKTIRAQLDAPANQMEFWTAPEREQLELNMQSLRGRLQQIPSEIERETANLRDRYRNPTPRLFPVTVTFLVPKKIAAESRILEQHGVPKDRMDNLVDRGEKTEMDGRLHIVPMDFTTVLRQAENRLLKLHEKIKSAPFWKERGIDTFLDDSGSSLDQLSLQDRTTATQ